MNTDELVEIVLDIDLNKEPECQGLMHPAGTYGHDDGPARWLLLVPCGCPHLQICDGRAKAHHATALTQCSDCGHIFPSIELIFIQL